MTDWYYHAPGRGRVGPLTAEQMREAYRDRVILRDTLAWHEGLREWQPLERLIEELGLSGVQPDLSKPPPTPPPRPMAATASHASRPTVPVEPPPSRRTGCLIAVAVVGLLGLFVIGILAAIAIPAYQEYVERSKQAKRAVMDAGGTFDADRLEATEALARELLGSAMREFYLANDRTCPDELEFDKLMIRTPRFSGSAEDGWFLVRGARSADGLCAYDVEFRGLGPELNDHTVRYELQMDGDQVAVSCRNVDLPAGRVPSGCGG